jgi:hypothetical protein
MTTFALAEPLVAGDPEADPLQHRRRDALGIDAVVTSCDAGPHSFELFSVGTHRNLARIVRWLLKVSFPSPVASTSPPPA